MTEIANLIHNKYNHPIKPENVRALVKRKEWDKQFDSGEKVGGLIILDHHNQFLEEIDKQDEVNQDDTQSYFEKELKNKGLKHKLKMLDRAREISDIAYRHIIGEGFGKTKEAIEAIKWAEDWISKNIDLEEREEKESTDMMTVMANLYKIKNESSVKQLDSLIRLGLQSAPDDPLLNRMANILGMPVDERGDNITIEVMEGDEVVEVKEIEDTSFESKLEEFKNEQN